MKQKPDYIKYNALKNAIYVPFGELMPCIRHCPFKDICLLYSDIYGKSNTVYSGSCSVEYAMYLELREYFNNTPAYSSVDKFLINEYIFLLISIERITKQISLNPGMVTDDKKLAKPYELLSRLQRKFLKVTETLIDVRCSDDGSVNEIGKQG